MKVSLKFDGGKELAAQLAGMPPRLSKKLLLEALAEAAEPLRARMEETAPRETGRLAEVVRVGRSRGLDAREAAVAVGATRAGFYGSFQEFGTARHAPQPWARPAYEQTWQQCLALLMRTLWGALAVRGNKAAQGRVTFGGTDAPSALQGEV